jgi:hypothetical protein
MFCIEQVDVSQLSSALEKYVSVQKVQPHQVAVRWAQITIVFCKARGLGPEALLQFEADGRWVLNLENQHLREYLLFVNYESQFRRLHILGNLRRQKLPVVMELGFVSVADLSQTLVHKLEPLEQLYLEPMRALQCFYQPLPDRQHLMACFPQDSLELFSAEFASITGIDSLAYSRVKELSPSVLAQRLYQTLLEEPFRLRYHAGLLFSAMHSELKQAFILKEQTLLRLRFEFCYRSERQRLAFVLNMFPGLVRPMEFRVGEQFHAAPEGSLGYDNPLLHALYTELFFFCQQFHPADAAPGVGFSVPARYCSADLLLKLGPRKGRLCVPHQELASVCCAYLAERISEHVLLVQRRHDLSFARAFWSRLILRSTNLGLGNKMSQQWLAQDVLVLSNRALQERVLRSTAKLCNDELFRRAIIPMLASLDGYYGAQDYQPEEQWPLRHARAVISDIHIGELPNSYTELLDYAAKLWPPCMQAMVGQCLDVPLHYRQRITMSALLRNFGYTLEQAQQLWLTMFSECDRAAATNPTQFFKSDHGRVLKSDYDKNNQIDIGTSCRYVYSCGLCPFKSMDIEECQQQCTNTAPIVLAFRISSPRNYFKQSSDLNKEL